MCAAVERAVGFDAMADDLAVTMRARRRQQMDRAFETVEGMRRAALHHLERLVVVVTANFALSHHPPIHGPANRLRQGYGGQEAGHYVLLIPNP